MNSLPVVAAPLEVLVSFLPGKSRLIRRGGIELWTLHYWHEDLAPFVGCDEPQWVNYDPRDITRVYVRGPDKQIRECELLDAGITRMSLPEWNRMRKLAGAEGVDPTELEARDAGMEHKDRIIKASKKATAAAHRMQAREQERQQSATQITGKPIEESNTPRSQLTEGPIRDLSIESLN